MKPFTLTDFFAMPLKVSNFIVPFANKQTKIGCTAKEVQRVIEQSLF